ncbi:hypothetical protein [Vibrio salinus]|uniref:hypothetical protein n=1 Tax=Vibrio salinus TaxID=2899784 RepID=UPI001E464DA7|nr:hypothetical protein [Vibrio salinus]MCE0493806.1 hypothetical protein [Vibrio salinus]
MNINVDTIKSSNVILIGGIDRSGTTKLGYVLTKIVNGYFLPEIFPITMTVIHQPQNYSKAIKQFFNSYRVENHDIPLYNALMKIQLLETDTANIRLCDFWLQLSSNLDRTIIETSPLNLEMSLHINNPFISKIYCYRDINEVWASHKKISWGPTTIVDMMRDYEKRLTLIKMSSNETNTWSINYLEIPKIEQLIENDDTYAINLPEFTKKQHNKVAEKFSHKIKKEKIFDKYFFQKSIVLDRTAKKHNFISILFFEVMQIIVSLHRVFTTRFLLLIRSLKSAIKQK